MEAKPNPVAAVADHGGSLERARALFPQAPEPWVDLSTGINPHSYPLFDLPATAFARLPEPARLDELAGQAAAAYGAPSSHCVVPAPGTQSLLAHIARLVAPGRARILGPTYAEHARVAALAGHRVEEVGDIAALEGADLGILVNPNNPDGRMTAREPIVDMAARMQGRGGLLVVDEAFMDVTSDTHSVAGDIGQGGLVVLRSFGKFFGLAGIRLGFALTAEPLAEKLKDELGPWAVSGPALEYGLKALGDSDWQRANRQRLEVDAARLDRLLAAAGLPQSTGTALFRFLRFAGAPALFDHLGRHGIMTRAFSAMPNALRIGLPGSESEWKRLAAALESYRGEPHE